MITFYNKRPLTCKFERLRSKAPQARGPTCFFLIGFALITAEDEMKLANLSKPVNRINF
jgi:hypothetical protein